MAPSAGGLSFPAQSANWLLAYNWSNNAALGTLSALTVKPNEFAQSELTGTCVVNGRYQLKNIVQVLEAFEILKELGFKLSEHNLLQGLKKCKQNTGFYGRWDIINHKPTVIVDVVPLHNILVLVAEIVTAVGCVIVITLLLTVICLSVEIGASSTTQ
ncbi:MAG: hypothetical protein RL596_2114 [Bacteroidota bacterium]